MSSPTSGWSKSKFKIYTKTGDSGSSSLFNGERRQKSDHVFQCLGDVDELNSWLGVVRCQLRDIVEDDRLGAQLEVVQSRLLDAGTAIATPLTNSSSTKQNIAKFPADNVVQVESWIDSLDEELPPIIQFLLPSGCAAGASLHVCRTVCRRSERKVSDLISSGSVDVEVGKYLNRLSDYLFTAARYINMKTGFTETNYKKRVELPT